jgi:hypothetical protein
MRSAIEFFGAFVLWLLLTFVGYVLSLLSLMLAVGAVLAIGVLIAMAGFIVWALRGTVPRGRLEERCAEWLCRPLPSVGMRPARAMELAKSITLGEKWNKELMDYFMDWHDAEKMEDLLDMRCGLGRWANTSAPTPVENIRREIERVTDELSVFIRNPDAFHDASRLSELRREHEALVQEYDHLEWRAEMMARVQESGV